MHSGNSLIQCLQNNAVNKFSDFFNVFNFWAVNISSAFMLSAAHNVLFFVLDWRSPVFHFLHFGSVFLFLLTKMLLMLLLHSFFNRNLKHNYSSSLSLLQNVLFGEIVSAIYPAVLLQFIISLLSSVVHSQNRVGELYLLR